MLFILGRISSASSTIFLSFLLAMATIVAMAIWWPEGLTTIQNWAQWLENEITGINVPPRGTVWLNFLVDDQSLTFMLFTILARIVVAIFLTLVGRLFGMGDQPAL